MSRPCCYALPALRQHQKQKQMQMQIRLPTSSILDPLFVSLGNDSGNKAQSGYDDCGSDAGNIKLQSGTYSYSFELYAAIGEDPDIDQVNVAFVTATEAVLGIDRRQGRRQRLSRMHSRDKSIEVSAEAAIIDCDKLDIYYGFDDGIRCFSVDVAIVAMNGKMETEVLASAVEVAVLNGELSEKIKEGGTISVLLAELAPETSSNDESQLDGYDGLDVDYLEETKVEEPKDDLKSVGFFLPSSEDSSLDLKTQPQQTTPASPSAVNDVTGVYPRTRVPPYTLSLTSSMNSIRADHTTPNFTTTTTTTTIRELRIKSKQVVSFHPLVSVKNTLSRYDMSPKETYNYWIGEKDFLTNEQCNRLLTMLMENWTRRKDKEYREQEQQEQQEQQQQEQKCEKEEQHDNMLHIPPGDHVANFEDDHIYQISIRR